MNAAAMRTSPPAPFDSLSATYDDVFTNTLTGRAQRNAIWKGIDSLWVRGDRVLELNCGTGEDAVHLASRGIHVFGCDQSSAMVEIARAKCSSAKLAGTVEFHVLPNENLGELRLRHQLDGVLSNFSGLNCVPSLAGVAQQLAEYVRSNAPAALCFSTRYCAWEFFWYALKGDLRRAIRRWKGHTEAHIGGQRIHVWYPTIRQIERAFSPWFKLEYIKGVGITVPPSYVENWIAKRPRLFEKLVSLEDLLSRKPLFREIGDHVLLRFRRCDT